MLKSAPSYAENNIIWEVITGSQSYGVSRDNSDMDLVGVCIPPKTMLFPHLAGEIIDLSKPAPRFKTYQQHGMVENGSNKEYDYCLYSITWFFRLVMENNPNMLDCLFTPRRCVTQSNAIGEMIRSERKRFLHKGCKQKIMGYAYSQLKKLKGKNYKEGTKRQQEVAETGMDMKFAYHVVRLVLQGEQILSEGDLDIERNKETLKDIRAGNWSVDRINQWFTGKESFIDDLYLKSDLQYSPDTGFVYNLFMNCVEQHYGSIADFDKQTLHEQSLRDIKSIIDRAGL